MIVFRMIARHSMALTVTNRKCPAIFWGTAGILSSELRESLGIVEMWHRTKDLCVFFSIKTRHLLSDIKSRTIHLKRRLDHAENLVVQRVSSPIPHEELALAYVKKRWRTSYSPPCAQRDLAA